MVIPACRGRVWIPFPPHLDTAIQYSGELGRDESFIPLSQSPSNNPVPPKLLSGTLPKDWLMISSLELRNQFFQLTLNELIIRWYVQVSKLLHQAIPEFWSLPKLESELGMNFTMSHAFTLSKQNN
ncbi:hypothetical protein NPIL_355191 [Nephila pilipes]|uniref:Uncharacterized protein n=1 Tax=Nephila pilipes TaxID=299642 RepID=A0A8X6NCY5_NEPPI|nr:hypothetical protein NPIL_355191 [Nephila pilipes]